VCTPQSANIGVYGTVLLKAVLVGMTVTNSHIDISAHLLCGGNQDLCLAEYACGPWGI
jgi:hypothetical protein